MIKSRELLQLNNEGIYKVEYTGEILYNVLLQDKYDKMIVNNLFCETLDPNNGIAKMYYYLKNNNYNFQEKQNIIKQYNNLLNKTIDNYIKKNKSFRK